MIGFTGRTSRAVVVAVMLMTLTAFGGDPECPQYISCDESEPCTGELTGELVIDLRDINIEWGGVFMYFADLDFCYMACEYIVEFPGGETEQVNFGGLDCEDFELD